MLFGLLDIIHNGITSVGIGSNFAWGLAIIVLTLLVRLLMHPLTAKQMASMQKMQKLQPQLKVLQEKYADDKDKLNAETMALYKDNKVNPASGCLPLIIQLPIFILLYGVLYDLTKTEGLLPSPATLKSKLSLPSAGRMSALSSQPSLKQNQWRTRTPASEAGFWVMLLQRKV